jgi:hypothetical protein
VEEFPSNTRKARIPDENEPKKIEKVTTGEVVTRKMPLGKRLLGTFFGGDAKGVVGHVIAEVLLPAAKDAIADAFSQGIERLIFGEARSTSRRTGQRPGGSSGYVSYNRYSSPTSPPAGRREEPRNVSRRARGAHDFDEIILATRIEAEEVIDRLFDLVARYEQATVSDLYELVGVSGNFTDEKWGWTDVRGAGVTRIRNGYLLDLPRPVQLD